MYEWELKLTGPKKQVIVYKDTVIIHTGQPAYSATEEVLFEEALINLQDSYPDIRANIKRKGISNTASVGNNSVNIDPSAILFDVGTYKQLTLEEVTKLVYSVLNTLDPSGENKIWSDYNNLDLAHFHYYGTWPAPSWESGVQFRQAIINKATEIVNLDSLASYNTPKSTVDDNTQPNIPQSGTTGTTLNSLAGDTLKKATDSINDSIVKLQGIGLPPIKDIPQILWDKVIKPRLLTERQIAKKIILLANQSFPIPMTEEDAQLIVYGKIYYKDDVLYDNDAEDPACVAKPGDIDYQPPIDETHPLWQKIVKYIKEFKDSLIQLGIKLGEFLYLIPATIANVAISLTSLVSSIIIVPFGAGIPTALTAVQTMITSIKTLQAKFSELLPLLSGLTIISLLLPKSMQDIISKITSILTVISTILASMTSILGLIDIIMSLFNKAQRKMKSIPVTVKAKANPTIVKQSQSTILTVEVSGGDYDYIYEWTDSNGTVIAKDPNSGDDDGTREVTPIVPVTISTVLKNGVNNLTNTYTCKVTDAKGKGTSATGSIMIIRG